jgi:hypothetical protein
LHERIFQQSVKTKRILFVVFILLINIKLIDFRLACPITYQRIFENTLLIIINKASFVNANILLCKFIELVNVY